MRYAVCGNHHCADRSYTNTGGAEFLYRSSLKLNFTEERKEIKTKCLEMQFATIADDNGEI